MTQDTKREALISRIAREAAKLETCEADSKSGYVTMPVQSARLLARDFRDAIAALSTHPTPTAEQGGEDLPGLAPDSERCFAEAWREYAADFAEMTDDEIAHEVEMSQLQIDEADSWLTAVASWEAAGKPRDGQAGPATLTKSNGDPA